MTGDSGEHNAGETAEALTAVGFYTLSTKFSTSLCQRRASGKVRFRPLPEIRLLPFQIGVANALFFKSFVKMTDIGV